MFIGVLCLLGRGFPIRVELPTVNLTLDAILPVSLQALVSVINGLACDRLSRAGISKTSLSTAWILRADPVFSFSRDRHEL
jgi:hypothetical protein